MNLYPNLLLPQIYIIEFILVQLFRTKLRYKVLKLKQKKSIKIKTSCDTLSLIVYQL